MRHLMTSLRRYAALFMATSALVACGGDSPTQTPQADTLAGTYIATTFRVTPTGQAMIDVLAQNGSLVLTIAADNSTTGSLLVPSAVPGGTALLASMLGTATRTGNTVRFQQTADTFVRDLTWTISGKTLQVTDLAAGSARFTVTLTRP